MANDGEYNDDDDVHLYEICTTINLLIGFPFQSTNLAICIQLNLPSFPTCSHFIIGV